MPLALIYLAPDEALRDAPQPAERNITAREPRVFRRPDVGITRLHVRDAIDTTNQPTSTERALSRRAE